MPLLMGTDLAMRLNGQCSAVLQGTYNWTMDKALLQPVLIGQCPFSKALIGQCLFWGTVQCTCDQSMPKRVTFKWTWSIFVAFGTSWTKNEAQYIQFHISITLLMIIIMSNN